MYSDETKQIISRELAAAQHAQQNGLIGRSRVCARRAAAAAAREFLQHRGIPLPASDAYTVLNLLTTIPQISLAAANAAVNLTRRVDEQFQLPVEISLIVEAQTLIHELEQGI